MESVVIPTIHTMSQGDYAVRFHVIFHLFGTVSNRYAGWIFKTLYLHQSGIWVDDYRQSSKKRVYPITEPGVSFIYPIKKPIFI